MPEDSEEQKTSVYFAHPRTTQNTSRAFGAIDAIKVEFPTFKIINPSDFSGSNMKFYLRLVANSDMLIFISSEDGFIGKGVFSEIRLARFLQKPVYFYNPNDQQFTQYFEILNINEEDWEKYAQVSLHLEKERPKDKKRLLTDFIQ